MGCKRDGARLITWRHPIRLMMAAGLVTTDFHFATVMKIGFE